MARAELSSIHAELRRRYEATPRAIEGDLVELAKGERGCLGDGLTALGVLLIVVFGALAFVSGVGQGYALIGAGLFVTGFILSTRGQARSTRTRRIALTSGALVRGQVVKGRPDLWERESVTGPAIVVFTTDPARRFDGALLSAVAGRLKALTPESGSADERALATELQRELVEGIVPLPASLTGDAEYTVLLATTIVDTHRLPGGRLTDGVLLLIVDPQREFVEHV